MNGENDKKREVRAHSQRAKAEANVAKRLLNAIEAADWQKFKGLTSNKELQLMIGVTYPRLFEGAAATFLTYFLLGRVRSIFVRVAGSRPAARTTTTTPPWPFASSTPGNGFSSTRGSSWATESPHVVNSPFQRPHPPSQIRSLLPTKGSSPPIEGGTSKQNDVLGRIVDFTASLAVGFIVSNRFLISPLDAIDKTTELPLIEGRSVLAEVVCPAILEEYRKMKQELKASGQGTSSTKQMDSDTQEEFSFSLDKAEPSISLDIQRAALEQPNFKGTKTLLKFVTNCRRRASYEKKLAREGATGGFPIKPFAMDIPPPGVPPDFQVSDDDTEDEWNDEFSSSNSSLDS